MPAFFSSEIGSLIEALLKKYSLTQSETQITERITNKQKLNGETLREAAENIITGDFGKESASSFIEQNVSVSKEIANNIVKDLAEQIVPLGQKISQADWDKIIQKEEPEGATSSPYKPVLKVRPINEKAPQDIKPAAMTKPQAPEIQNVPKKIKRQVKPINTEQPANPPPPRQKNSGPDRYREEI